ncbi:hypothetical protein [Cryobacterium sp. N19]|uniref:hypothetical protein n=1 Tax=Cryobacterium sp. N19 TaxID=2048288 RepID=UPI000CE4CB67|nr:hypothetical protein [Cryobacterium sp. N19]
MTSADAAEYLAGFLGVQPMSLDRFASTIDRELTFSPGSLEPVWDAVEPKLAWREGYEPPALGQPGPRIDADQLELPEDLPSWFHHPSSAGYARFSADTLWLIDGAARYLGELLIQTIGGRWASGSERVKGYMYQNQPVLTGIRPEPVSPMQTCSVLAARSLRQRVERGPQTLTDVYNAWSASARPQ